MGMGRKRSTLKMKRKKSQQNYKTRLKKKVLLATNAKK